MPRFLNSSNPFHQKGLQEREKGKRGISKKSQPHPLSCSSRYISPIFLYRPRFHRRAFSKLLPPQAISAINTPQNQRRAFLVTALSPPPSSQTPSPARLFTNPPKNKKRGLLKPRLHSVTPHLSNQFPPRLVRPRCLHQPPHPIPRHHVHQHLSTLLTVLPPLPLTQIT